MFRELHKKLGFRVTEINLRNPHKLTMVFFLSPSKLFPYLLIFQKLISTHGVENRVPNNTLLQVHA